MQYGMHKEILRKRRIQIPGNIKSECYQSKEKKEILKTSKLLEIKLSCRNLIKWINSGAISS